MKKQFKYFTGFYVLFLIAGVSCNSLIEDCGPFPEKYNVVSLQWDSVGSNAVQFEDFALTIQPVAASFFSSTKTKSFQWIQKSYACSGLPPETDDLIVNIEITANNDFSPLYTQGTNLIDVFDVEVLYHREGVRDSYALTEFLSMNRKFPDQMILTLNTPPAFSGEFSFVFKINIDGAELDYFEFNTNSFQIAI
jgi:hypothetical protein